MHFYVRDDLLDDRRRVDPDRLRAIGRLGGLSYCSTDRRFELPRGGAALAAPDPFSDDG